MSRAEEITSEVRRLVLTCRAMEAQLQQSIPKKTHEEVVQKMQGTINELDNEVGRMKVELEKTSGIVDKLIVLTSEVQSQKDTMASQGKAIESLSAQLSQSSVPLEMYNSALSKFQELEAKFSSMVSRADYESALKEREELQQIISGSMIAKEDYLALQVNSVPKEAFEELQRSMSDMVPRSQLSTAESRIQELESTLANYVPREEITSRNSRITELEAKLANSVSKAEFEELQSRVTGYENSYVPRDQVAMKEATIFDLEATIANSVPREQLSFAESRIAELESKLSETVPKSDYEAVSAKLAEAEATAAHAPETKTESGTLAPPDLKVSEEVKPEIQEESPQPSLDLHQLQMDNFDPTTNPVEEPVVSPAVSENVPPTTEVPTVVQTAETAPQTAATVEVVEQASKEAIVESSPKVESVENLKAEQVAEVTSTTTTENTPSDSALPSVEEIPPSATFSQVELTAPNIQVPEAAVPTSTGDSSSKPAESASQEQSSAATPESPSAPVVTEETQEIGISTPVPESANVEASQHPPVESSEPAAVGIENSSGTAPSIEDKIVEPSPEVIQTEQASFNQTSPAAESAPVIAEAVAAQESLSTEASLEEVHQLVADQQSPAVSIAETDRPIEPVVAAQEQEPVVVMSTVSTPQPIVNTEAKQAPQIPDVSVSAGPAEPQPNTEEQQRASIEVGEASAPVEVSTATVEEISPPVAEAPVVEPAPVESITSQVTVQEIEAQKELQAETATPELSSPAGEPQPVTEKLAETTAPQIETVAAVGATTTTPEQHAEQIIAEVAQAEVKQIQQEEPATESLTHQGVTSTETVESSTPEPHVAESVAAPVAAPTSEIREVQSQLSEIKSASDAGATTFIPNRIVVDYAYGFIFRNTGFCSRSGMEFLHDIEQVPIDAVENHMRNGDFEKWFSDVLSDNASASSLKTLRENKNLTGEELRAKIVAVVAPRYKY